jgi:hypothetical protein
MNDTVNPSGSGDNQQAKRWQPLTKIQRRVAGALVEKAKTTPDAYPMTLNAVCAACNQKSNRAPLMQLDPEDVEDALGELRKIGAVGLVEGSGRVSKYRHYLYEWLSVDKVELAVMAELLLRGPQTEGELRGRATRMEPIADLQTLRPIVASLKQKQLIVPLTPEGRGHVITHALYPPAEMDKLREQYGQAEAAPAGPPGRAPVAERPEPGRTNDEQKSAQVLQRELDMLRGEVDTLRAHMDELAQAVHEARHELGCLKKQMGSGD